MAYCTPDDVRTLIPLIDSQTMADADVQKFITKAEAYVDGALRDTYAVPFNPVPELIKDVTAEYCAYLILRTVYFQNTPNMTDVTKELKNNAENTLKALANGDLNLDAPMVEDSVISDEFEQKIFTLEDITPPWGDWT